MTNLSLIRGALIRDTLVSCKFNEKVRTYITASTDTTALFAGDFVKMTGAFDSNGLPIVTQGAATDSKFVGIVVGLGIDSLGFARYRLPSTIREVYVSDDPLIQFEIQANGGITTADAGKRANIIVGSGDTSTGLSGMQLDISTLSSTVGQLKIIDISPTQNNEIGTNAKLICMIADHEFNFYPTGEDLWDYSSVTNTLSTIPADANVTIGGKLTVDGLIDPTALILSAQATAPVTTNGTIYYDSVSSKFLFREADVWNDLDNVWNKVGTILTPTISGDYTIASTSNGDITLAPNGTGGFIVSTPNYASAIITADTFASDGESPVNGISVFGTTEFSRLGVRINPDYDIDHHGMLQHAELGNSASAGDYQGALGWSGYIVGNLHPVYQEVSRNVNNHDFMIDCYQEITGIFTQTISAAGTGYTVGDQLLVAGGTGGYVIVNTIGGSGEVLTTGILIKGSSYTSGVKTTTGGTGADCTINVVAGDGLFHTAGTTSNFRWNKSSNNLTLKVGDSTATSAGDPIASWVDALIVGVDGGVAICDNGLTISPEGNGFVGISLNPIYFPTAPNVAFKPHVVIGNATGDQSIALMPASGSIARYEMYDGLPGGGGVQAPTWGLSKLADKTFNIEYWNATAYTSRIKIDGLEDITFQSTEEFNHILQTTSADVSEVNTKYRKSRTGGIITTGDRLGRIDFEGHDGTGYYEAASIRVISTGTIAEDRVPGYMQFYTTGPTGTITERVRLDQNGNFGFGSTSFGSGAKVISIGTVTTAPTVNPSNAALMWVDGTDIKFLKSNGDIVIM